MKLFAIVFATVLSLSPLDAQPEPPDPSGRRGPSYDAVTAYLGLTGEQLIEIQAAKEAARDSIRNIQQQIAEKRQALRTEMELESPNAAIVGQWMIEMKDLQQQGKAVRQQVRENILALLTEAQVAALASLEQARELMPTVRQAANLGLLEPREREVSLDAPAGHQRPGPRNSRRGGFPGPR